MELYFRYEMKNKDGEWEGIFRRKSSLFFSKENSRDDKIILSSILESLAVSHPSPAYDNKEATEGYINIDYGKFTKLIKKYPDCRFAFTKKAYEEFGMELQELDEMCNKYPEELRCVTIPSEEVKVIWSGVSGVQVAFVKKGGWKW